MSDSGEEDPRSLIMNTFTHLGDDQSCFDVWFMCFDERCTFFGIPEEPRDADGNFLKESNQRRSLFLLSLGLKVYRSLRGRCYPDQAHELPIPKLAEMMRKMYCPSQPLISRYEFNCRFQREDETGHEFGLALLSLAEHCKFGEFHQEALRDRFICGLRDANLRQALLMKTELTFIDAWSEATLFQWSEARSREEIQGFLQRLSGCSHCGPNHDKGKCPAQHWQCRKCKQFGHGAKFCQS